MRKKTTLKFFIGFFLLYFWILPSSISAQTQTIKVINDNAKIYMYPDSTSTVIGNAPIDSEYESEGKIGEWFKIKFYSRLGVLVTGYIHESDVLPEKEAPELRPEIERPEIKRVNIKLAIAFPIISKMYNYEHSFPYREETFEAGVLWEPGFMFELNGGVGFFVIPMLEISGSLGTFSKSSEGLLRIDIPNPFFFNQYSSDEGETDVSLNASVISFGLNFFPITRGSMRPYLGGGASYISMKLKMVEGFYYTETIYSDLSHSVRFSDINYEDRKVNKWGIYILAGLNYKIFKNLNGFLEGRFTLAKDEMKDPIYDQKIEINLGGFTITTGLKFFF